MSNPNQSSSFEFSETGLPQTLKPYFQEYDFSNLHPDQHRELIIERTLAYGNRSELRWLFTYYGPTQLTKWIRISGHRRLPWRRYNLWCVLLDISPEPGLKLREKRQWPY